jgi:hypothetical protein
MGINAQIMLNIVYLPSTEVQNTTNNFSASKENKMLSSALPPLVKKSKKRSKIRKNKKRIKAHKRHKVNLSPNEDPFKQERVLFLILGILAILLAVTALVLVLNFTLNPALLWSACAFFFSFGILFLAVAVGFLDPFF